MFQFLLIDHLILHLRCKKIALLDLQILKAAVVDDRVLPLNFNLNGTLIFAIF